MGISPEHRPPLRPHCSRSEVALNSPAAVTDLIPPGPVHHLPSVTARRRDTERHLTAVEMSRIAATNLLNDLRGERLLICVNPEVYEG